MELQKYKNKNIIEVGVDEVGRGCLLGRVYAAAVILPNEFETSTYSLIKDSKKLSKSKRIFLGDYIKSVALDWGIGYADVEYIDTNNIYHASVKAMHNALSQLSIELDMIIIDGNKFKPYMDAHENYISYECIINGDNKYISIASASILAKNERDQYIIDLVNSNPILDKYDLKNNMGYGTQKHRDAIENYGITKFHRKTFGICKKFR